jgi:micrococcal nuclease
MVRPSGLRQRAPQTGALFVLWLLLLLAAPLQAQECLPFHADEWVESAYVYDGDTIRLKDGRKVRFIGINTPEIGHHGDPSEPLGPEARRVLMGLLADNPRVALQYEAEKKDRYGRLLAHVYLSDRRNVQEVLLRQGLAATVAVAPNVANVDCYLAVEKEAGSKGIWQQPRYQGVETTRLPADASGFYVLKGKVVRLGESRKSYWLNFSGDVAARIAKKNLPYFDKRLDVRQLEGRTLKVRGWLYHYKGETRLSISHPAVIEVLE